MTPPEATGFLAATPAIPTIDGVSRNTLSGFIPVLLVTLAVVALVVIWAVFLRRTPRDPRDRVLTDESRSSEHRRRRHRRREHRPTNPTLAETGGLPPPKSEAARRTDA